MAKPDISGYSNGGGARMTDQPTVFIVDDDASVRTALSLLMRSANLAAELYSSARGFLTSVTADRPGCLILDLRMPEVDGLELQRQLAARGSRLPIIMLTGHGDVSMAVQALRAGAFDFVSKPFESKALVARIREAIELDARLRKERLGRAAIDSRLKTLSPREAEVLSGIVDGLSTKEISAALGSSFNTVQNQIGRA